MLKLSAFEWWDAHKKSYPENYQVTWSTFKDAFNKKYFPESVNRMKEKEFLELNQGSKSVTDYDVEFSRLARFAPEFVQTDSSKAQRFENGLRKPLKCRVKAFELPRSVLIDQITNRYIAGRKSKNHISGLLHIFHSGCFAPYVSAGGVQCLMFLDSGSQTSIMKFPDKAAPNHPYCIFYHAKLIAKCTSCLIRLTCAIRFNQVGQSDRVDLRKFIFVCLIVEYNKPKQEYQVCGSGRQQYM
jgi:hypothetical protein